MSDDICGVFDSVIAQGFVPQVLEAYNEHDDIIYPNNVPAKLRGAIVCVTCTIKKALFKGSRFAGMTSLKRKHELNEHDDADPMSKPLSTD
ncbi:hypothetical protein FRC06_001860 [Ceratobasidium sp. 370]|nr:hypothetical protein FRC06_001860 [Ceratobasidium sp. 370]